MHNNAFPLSLPVALAWHLRLLASIECYYRQPVIGFGMVVVDLAVADHLLKIRIYEHFIIFYKMANLLVGGGMTISVSFWTEVAFWSSCISTSPISPITPTTDPAF